MRRRSLHKPFLPPRRFFVDGAHYAAALALLDGVERVRAAWLVPDRAGKVQFAEHALASLASAETYLALSQVERAPGFECRPDHGRAALTYRLHATQLQAERLLRQHDPERFGLRPVLILALPPETGMMLSEAL